MLLPLLLAALAQAPTDHAALHPASSDLYFELADPAALAQAMRSAPLVRTFRDEDVAAFLSSVTGQAPVDPDDFIEQMWLTQVPEGERVLLEGLRKASLSLRVDQPLPAVQAVFEFANEDLAVGLVGRMRSEAQARVLEAPGWADALAIPGPDGVETWAVRGGARIVLGLGAGPDAGLEGRFADGTGSLAGLAPLQRADTALGTFEATSLVHGFFRRSPATILAELLMATPDAPRAELEMLADANLMAGAHRFRMGTREGRYVTEFFSPSSEETSVANGLLGVAPVDPALAASIPTGVMGAYATTIDPERIAAAAVEGLALAGQPDLLESIEGQLGFPLQRLFTHLGQQVTVSSQAIRGLGLPETAVWVELQDEAAFSADLAAVAETLPTLMPGLEARTRDYKVKNAEGERVPYPITTITLPDGLIPIPDQIPLTIQPSLTIADGRLLIGLSSTHVKRELKRLKGATPPDPTAVDPWGAAGFELPENAHASVFVDWGTQIAGLVSLGKAFAPMAGDALPFDVSAIPDGETFVREFRPTVHFQVQREDGVYRYHEASFGPETWSIPLIAGMVMPRTMAMSGAMPVESAPTPAQSSPSGSLETELALAQVRAALNVYSSDQGQLPGALTDLLGGSEAYPSGFLPAGSLPADGWGNDLVYKRGEGDAYSLYSKGPNGRDDGGTGDDITVQ